MEYMKGKIVEERENGDFVIVTRGIENDRMWLSMLLGFGDSVKVLEPQEVIDMLMEKTLNNGVDDFYIAGADAAACVKSTCFNLRKAKYGVTVLSDCITSYDKRKIDEMLLYYESKGCKIISLDTLLSSVDA
ncbi:MULTISPECIES: isochorismatase family protein [Extibacter]|uniref:isochorismatase family protein n=1 Tax=Extibacter TaxID=1918452 RepID=UPI001AA1372B|nr:MULTISPECIES: isochorismatase family protein [Extibacter]BDF34714.1 hypothetical protein CE91St61_27890 [Lachnospiraceae bacterium]MBO1720553.1 isochorismatase family protein [Extibacter sp. GGCC_0201]MCQ4662980.1 isochorismatase family protein [Extibacter muris]MCQ4693246.1 isochorismatase family protein [Extibacter muris]BDF38716.1 hypothetical protein CE91St62_27770 [Lachnospiraceae bacterium]